MTIYIHVSQTTPTAQPTIEFANPTYSAPSADSAFAYAADDHLIVTAVTLPSVPLFIVFFTAWYAIILVMAIKWAKRFIF